jgi:hypothetical protein
MNKPNCYECKHRRSLPGDTHSRCAHPANDEMMENTLVLLMHVANRKDNFVELSPLHVVGDEHGIKKGWFGWPFNFDPTWLVECDGFEPLPVTLSGGGGVSSEAIVENAQYREIDVASVVDEDTVEIEIVIVEDEPTIGDREQPKTHIRPQDFTQLPLF